MGGESPISFASIDAYARRYGIEDLEFDFFHTILGAMDDEYLVYVAEVARDERAKRKDREDHP